MGACGSCSATEPPVPVRQAPALVLLGPHGAGKTTLVKQLQLSCSQVTEKDRAGSLNTLVKRSIMGHLQSLGNQVRDFAAVHPTGLPDEVVHGFDRLQKALNGANLDNPADREVILQVVGTLVENAELLKPLTRIGGLNYEPTHFLYLHAALSRLHKEGSAAFRPTDAEIVRLHWHTVGLVEMNLNVAGHTMGVVDTGGLSSEQKKWRHLQLDPSTTLVFVLPLDCFSQTMTLPESKEEKKTPDKRRKEEKQRDREEQEEPSKQDGNKLQEALALFRMVAKDDARLRQQNLCVILNRVDRLRELVAEMEKSEEVKQAFDRCFPDYKGDITDDGIVLHITNAMKSILPEDKQNTPFVVSSAIDDPSETAVLRDLLLPPGNAPQQRSKKKDV